MIRVREAGALSFAKLFALAFGLLGILAGAMYSVGGAIYDLVATRTVNWGTALAFLALIGMPLAFAIVGALVGMLSAPMFNIVARLMNGIELELEE